MSSKEHISNLLEAVKKGDQAAFKAIHDLHYKKLNAFVSSFTKNKAETDDIIQETFIKLWNSRENLSTVNSISGFLFRTTYNTFIDKYRKDKRYLQTLDSWKYKRLMEAIEEDDEIRILKIEKLKLAIDTLPKRCKEVFIMCKYENLTHSEIAAHLDISPKTVHAQMSKAYHLIRERFKENDSFALFLHFAKNLQKKAKKLMHFSG